MRWGLIIRSGEMPSQPSDGSDGFCIDTHEKLGVGYLATRYDAVFRNPQTNETTKVLKFEDTLRSDYYVLTACSLV